MSEASPRSLYWKDFNIGFELEFGSGLLDKKYGSASAIRDRRIRIPFGTLGEDGLRYEIRTRPLRGDLAPGLMCRCLDYMQSVSARTRTEDGLHINVSLVKKDLNLKINPLQVWIFAKPKYWSLRFGRTRCWACRMPRNYTQPELLEFISSAGPSGRRLAINFSHFRPRQAPIKSRVEFRYPGGKNYHQKPDLLLSCLNSALSAIAKSLGASFQK